MIALYNPRPIVAKSFKGVKRCTVPKQSMSLAEIVRRFVRRESVPVYVEGVYEERFGDLEKLSKGDIYDQMETVQNLKNALAKVQAREVLREEKEAADKKAAEELEVEKRIAAAVAAKESSQTAK